jgi:hypothetical protein
MLTLNSYRVNYHHASSLDSWQQGPQQEVPCQERVQDNYLPRSRVPCLDRQPKSVSPISWLERPTFINMTPDLTLTTPLAKWGKPSYSLPSKLYPIKIFVIRYSTIAHNRMSYAADKPSSNKPPINADIPSQTDRLGKAGHLK